jgi:hypothetical protein
MKLLRAYSLEISDMAVTMLKSFKEEAQRILDELGLRDDVKRAFCGSDVSLTGNAPWEHISDEMAQLEKGLRGCLTSDDCGNLTTYCKARGVALVPLHPAEPNLVLLLLDNN